METKICSSCNKEFPVIFFYKDKRKEGRYYSKCKNCKNAYKKEYRIKNKDKRKEYYENNKKELNEISRKRYNKNRKKILKRQILYIKKNKFIINSRRRKNRKENPKYKIRDTISRRINSSVKSRNIFSKKTSSIWKILNYSPEDLVRHLESLFIDDMTWDNYGTVWVIDHIIPDSWFKYFSYNDPIILQSWDIRNLRPCFVEENLRKSNSFAGIYNNFKTFEEFKEKGFELCIKEILSELHT